MDCCDSTEDSCVWSQTAAVPAVEANQACLQGNHQAQHHRFSNSTTQYQPYRPLGNQQQAAGQYQHQPQSSQTNSGYPPYRPLDAQHTQTQAPMQAAVSGYSHQVLQQPMQQQVSHNSSSSSCYTSFNSNNSIHSGSFHASSSDSGLAGHARHLSDAQGTLQQQGGGYRATSNSYNRNYNSGRPGHYNGGSWGSYSSSRYGGSYNNNSSSNSSRGFNRSRSWGGGYGSRGPSPRPQQGGPVPWVRQGCWLVPRNGNSSTAAATTGAAARAVEAPGEKADDSVVIIMRGLPGSGKSTRSAQLAEAAKQAAAVNGMSADAAVAIHSTDSYFTNAAGVYMFDVDLLSINHQKNFEAFCKSLAAGVHTIIVDNTNIQPWQFEKYVTAAWQAGYKVKEEVIGEFTEAAAAQYAVRNTHNVPHDKILMMLDQWGRQ